MNRKATLGLGLAVVVAASASGWAAGRQIRSPAEIAARTATPAPSLITVPVERRPLTSEVVTRGTVRFGSPQLVTLATSALRGTNGIVTAAPTKGAGVDEGGVALAVSGRPVFVLEGPLPAYRDLGPGTVGEDVRQLEAALVRLGFSPGPTDGTYDGRTAAAVAAWYTASGWTPQGPTTEQLTAQRSAQADAFGAQSELVSAQEALATARTARAAANERARAARALAAAAPGSDAAVQAKAHYERLLAAAEVAKQSAAVASAVDAERVAQLSLADALLPKADASTASPGPTTSELAALEANVGQTAAAVGVARADLNAAQASPAAFGSSSSPDLAAEADLAAAAAEVEAAFTSDAVPAAERRVTVAAGRAALGSATEAGRALGTQILAGELLFFPTLPVRIEDAKVKVGDQPSGPVMTVTTARLAIDAALSVGDAKLVRKGAAVAIAEPELGIKAEGEVSEVADTPGTRGVDPQRFFVEVNPTVAPPSLVGASVLLTITVESTGGEVLAVPVSALSVAADGTSRLQVQKPDRTTRDVTVTPGLAAQGLVAVTPMGGELNAGDLVVVGLTARTAGGNTTQPSNPTTNPGGSNAP